MNNQLIKTILFGALLGAALFAAPFFILKVLLFFLVIGFFFRIFRGRGYYHRRGGGWGYRGWAFADKIRQMDDKEFEEFKTEYSGRGRCWPGDSKEEKESEEPKA